LEAWRQLTDLSARNLQLGKYKLTIARIGTGNISIGMIRKRAGEIKGTEYAKLRQSLLTD
jgi:hypothetical protein